MRRLRRVPDQRWGVFSQKSGDLPITEGGARALLAIGGGRLDSLIRYYRPGLTLARTGSRNLAYTILEIDRGELDFGWLKDAYQERQTARIRKPHSFRRFLACSINGHFSELKEFLR